ncbi:MAG TPA: hypothetical protein VLA00_13785 [Xanthobacteraceae bacterium]|nr:hypothetical protein [Xanthobacteraceae bacterium]
MQIDENKRPRTALKTYFATNAIPTAAQFAQFIDSGLNQRDDGIVKTAGDPLSIEAAGDEVGLKKALNFYTSFADADPAWSVALRPRANPADARTGRPGWSVNDAAGNSRLSIDASTGNVGIGTVAPADKLEVAGRVRAGALSIGPWPANPGSYGFVGSNLLDQANPANYALLQGTGPGEPGVTYLNSPSRVGIRIANADRLTVANDGATVLGSLKIAGSDLYFTETNHNHTGFGNTIGFAAIENAASHGALMIIGRSVSTAPLRRVVKLWDWLEVNGTLDIVGDVSIRGKHALRGSDTWLRLNQDSAFPNGVHTPGLFAPTSLNVGGRGGWANPGTNNAWIVGDLLVMGRIGAMNLGPGPRTPGWQGGMRTFDLEVEATAWARNGLLTGPRDLAEIYFSAEPLEPGDVVSLAVEGDGIVPAARARDPRVIGIVSSQPGLLLGSLHNVEPVEDGRTGHPVALLGCVPCKVTDEGGPIRRGDLLTAASRSGHAMRAPDAGPPGTILGKALAPLAAGNGTIDVFVMLR